ncbi:tetratricopeptide repeat protein [Eupransor demetentiae]|uniref:Tetratricopeptide (TPR) repeat (TPR) n=1 Tax=Eupransor demetentiae TaxID=3109584 RepID=A0ABM9N3U9_9LACO|nr:Tetratricopeptide (TPR) repeat (TPR) [Lactobacillaceae bacterium LMG 33000]
MSEENTSYAEEMLAAIHLGQFDQADKLFKKALAHDSDDLIYSLGEELYAQGFLDQAKAAYQHLLDKFPLEGSLKVALADIAIDEGQTDQAQEYLADVEEDSPAFLQALMVKADLYQSEGLTESAEHCLNEAHRLAPDDDVVAFALAEFNFSNGNYAAAIKQYRDLLLKGQRHIAQVDIVSRIGNAYAAVGNYDNAIGYLEQIKPELLDLNTKFQLALLYFETDRTDDAIDLFKEVLEQDSHYTSVYPLLGQAYQREGNDKEARQTFQLGLSMDQTNPILYRLAAQAAQKDGDKEEALEDYQAALKLDELDPTNYDLLAKFYLDQHDFSAVVQLLTEAEENDIHDAHFDWDLARAYHALEKEDLAQERWQAAQAELADDAAFLLDLADWHHEMGHVHQEKDNLQKYVQLVPDDFEAQERLNELD